MGRDAVGPASGVELFGVWLDAGMKGIMRYKIKIRTGEEKEGRVIRRGPL